ncbi:MAG: T9SS type A sorting domain-containing protein [Bacteroidia bacterium]|nr:T9SS type A sorting domain-containing protein [Bacteroidia bacterium]
MKYIYKFLLLITLMPGIMLLIANSNGSPGGSSGSPGDGNQTCTTCHTGTAVNQAGWISTNIPAEGYVPGTTYQVTLSPTHAGAARFGFELTAETGTGQKTGTFAITQSNRTKLVNQNRSVTHTFNGTTPSGGGTSWTMNWTAPATAAGNITFYAAINAANGNGGTGGDVIYRTTLSVQPMAPAALTTVQPSSAGQGETVTLTIAGTNTAWTGTSPSVQLVLATNQTQTINAQMVAVNSATQLQAQFIIPGNATAGLYHVKVNTLQLDNAFTIFTVTSIAENNERAVSVYPNPSNGQNIKIEHRMNQPQLRILDINGKVVYHQAFVINNETLNLQQLSQGIYTLMLTDAQGSRIEKLIIR